MRLTLAVASVLSIFALANAYDSFNALLETEIFPDHIDAVQTKSGDSSILGQLRQLLNQPAVLSQLHENYKVLYNKNDGSRLGNQQIFARNLLEIASHNLKYEAGASLYVQGVNQFTDMNSAELSHYFGYKINLRSALNASGLPKADPTYKSRPLVAADPTYKTFLGQYEYNDDDNNLDWRKKQKVSPVKDQKNCGSCVAFSMCGSMESAHAIKNNEIVDLSEQELVDCVDGNEGCDGGSFPPALKRLSQPDGITTEELYPYKAKNQRCKRKKDQRNKAAKTAGLASYGTVEPQADEGALKEAVKTYGPVSIALHVSSSFQRYKRGIYEGPCDGGRNHAVVAVGYGIENGNEYWIVKNSWNDRWGDKGFIRIKRNANNMCDVAGDGAYVIAE